VIVCFQKKSDVTALVKNETLCATLFCSNYNCTLVAIYFPDWQGTWCISVDQKMVV